MRLLVFQHLPVENPGVFLELWAGAGHSWDVVEFDRDQPIPQLEDYDLLAVMGGPMDVWQEEQFPWLRREKAAIRRWVAELDRPYLGICLGHQLLADALGGEVGLMRAAEVGIEPVQLTPAGEADPLFHNIGARIETLQWHGAEVKRLPTGAIVLASSDTCTNQAIRVGRHAYGLQFHIEIVEATVTAWGEIPEYKQSLEQTLGATGVAALNAEVLSRLPDTFALARQVDENLASIIANAASHPQA
jgi:GMP synthase-like glutamine amidotransferase